MVIKGHNIVSKKTIQAVLQARSGSVYRLKTVRKDVKSIFNTGWFDDVSADWTVNKKNQGVLTYTVREKPIVAKLVYKGQKTFSTKKLDEIFQFSPHEFLDHKKLLQAVQNLRLEYEKKGFYLAKISYFVQKTKHPKRVKLVVQIKENKKVKVKKIVFLGNKALSAEEIKKFMRTSPAGLFSFLTGSGAYSRSALEKDLNNIRFIYLDRGYWKVHVGRPDVFISPDRKDLSITIPIHEGHQYTTGSIQFGGDLLFSPGELKDELETSEGDVFSYGKLQRDIQNIQTRYGDHGYAFVNVIPKFFLQRENQKTVHVMFDIQKGKKTYIRKIIILGHHYTRDKVIRREIRVFEGELYNETRKKQSVVNIKRLGFFDEVQILPKTIKGRGGLTDLEVIVKEKENNGTLDLSIAHDGYQGFTFRGKVHKFNVFGTGRSVGVDLNLNFIRQHINFNFTDPYFLDSNWYLGGDFFLDNWSDDRESQNIFKTCNQYETLKAGHESKAASGQFKTPGDLNTSAQHVQLAQTACWSSLPGSLYRGFSEQKISGGFTLGRSLIVDALKVLVYYRLENVTLTNSIDENLFPTAAASGLRNPIELIMEYDLRNDRLLPTSGFYSRGSVLYDGVLGKFNYLTLSANVRFYQKLIWKFVFRTNVQYSRHLPLDDGPAALPFDRLFRLGGINSLRGFEFFSVGPRKHSTALFQKALKYGHPNPQAVADRVYGAGRQLFANWELQAPIVPSAKVFGLVFIDAGAAYNDLSFIDWRANWGVGLRLFTPLGPFRFELGFPFAPRFDQGEKTSNMNFTMGLSF